MLQPIIIGHFIFTVNVLIVQRVLLVTIVSFVNDLVMFYTLDHTINRSIWLVVFTYSTKTVYSVIFDFFMFCSDEINLHWKDSPKSMLDVYHELIRSGLRIWVFRFFCWFSAKLNYLLLHMFNFEFGFCVYLFWKITLVPLNAYFKGKDAIKTNHNSLIKKIIIHNSSPFSGPNTVKYI